ncbi:MAG: glycosyltransferase family 4 protein [Gammaproteobacteria bacterium]|nr:glycosyltransferase family 4 protein [Gammaproteobacteria bacterium]
MKLLFLTNMPSYHQIELADAFEKLLGSGNFCMGLYSPISEARIAMNWQDSYQADYLQRYSQSEEARQIIHQWIDSADVVIQGRFPIRFLRHRISGGGLTFAYQERIWKKGFSVSRLIRRLPHLYKNYWSVNRHNYHLLAAGAYASQDLLQLGIFKNRCWKFGYFIKARAPLQKPQPRAKLNIVWCGQMIALKQPGTALEMIAGLRAKGIDLHFTMIGGGELCAEIAATVSRMQLDEYVEMTGWQSTAEVNAHMAAADIMLMTSDQREGWGLVINEAINNQCLVVANEAAGAARWLIEDGESGIVYRDEHLAATIDKLAALCHDRQKLSHMAQTANDHLTRNWSTEVAAERVVRLTECLSGSDMDIKLARNLYQQGPCSAE